MNSDNSTAAEAGAASRKKAKSRKGDGSVQISIGAKKEEDFSSWYTDVLLKANMLDYYDVSGCYVLRPWAFSIWEEIQKWFDAQIKLLGVQNAYFPLFIPGKVLEKEKEHIEGFSAEVAWVTKAGQSDLDEPIAIRPTSETGMYPYYARWIKSHRDLPLKLNQWNNVVRWEFKHPQPFIRTREFLWQEGHTAHLTQAEADVEVRQILELYRQVYEDLLAVPVIPGFKSEKEKFAGGLYTTTIEGFVPTSGRGIQAATSHSLGQNFSRPGMFDIFVENPNQRADGDGKDKKTYVWQNSWGLSTRTIGLMLMIHGDDRGLVLPPRVATLQVVIIPCGITARTTRVEAEKIEQACEAVADRLQKEGGIRAKADLREGYTPGWKFNDWEQKGVPLRLEIGPQDIQKNQTIGVRRDTGVKAPFAIDESLTTSVLKTLETIQQDMFTRAYHNYRSHMKEVTRWEDFVPTINAKCVAVIPWCEAEACEDDIKCRSSQASTTEKQDERAPSSGAKSLAIPFDQSGWSQIQVGKTLCPACGRSAKRWAMFGRSY